jgi:hypothetical protein
VKEEEEGAGLRGREEGKVMARFGLKSGHNTSYQNFSESRSQEDSTTTISPESAKECEEGRRRRWRLSLIWKDIRSRWTFNLITITLALTFALLIPSGQCEEELVCQRGASGFVGGKQILIRRNKSTREYVNKFEKIMK